MFKKIIYTFLGTAILYTILGFFILPFVVKSQAISYVKANLNKELQIQEVKFNPFLFQLAINNLSLKEANDTLIAFDNLYVDFDLDRTLAKHYIHFKTVSLSKPYVNVKINSNKELNLLTLIPKTTPENIPAPEEKTNNEIISLQLDTLAIIDANIEFNDFSQTKPLHASFNNLNYTFKDLSTLKGSLASQTLSTTLNNEGKLLFKGGLGLNPLKTYGTIEIKNMMLKPFIDTFNDQIPVQLDSKLSLDTKIGFTFVSENEPTFTLNNSSITVNYPHIKDKQTQTTLFNVDQFTIDAFNLTFPQTPKTKLLKSDFKLLINNGELDIDALVNTEPLNANVQFGLKQFNLALFNPIVQDKTFLDIKSALLNAKGNIDYQNNTLTTTGSASLKNVHLNHHNAPIIKANEVIAHDIYFSQEHNVLSIKSLNITSPYIFTQINEKAQLNLASLVKPSKETQANTPSKPFTLYVGPLDIKNGAMTFEDLTLPIHLKIDNHNINGTLSEFNSKSSKPTLVTLDGNIGKYGYMNINGNLVRTDFKSYSNFKVKFDNIALSDLSGYSGKFVGRKIEDGKLSMDLLYHIEKSKLEAKNNFIINKIKLGEKIQSEEAISLPLELAIAILEDKNGIIDIKLPLSGNLDDPKFSIAPIAWQAFTNIITKAITAPFSLLGSLFGFGEDEINQVPFYFGKATITSVQKEPLDKIASILKSRNKLSITINPSIDEKNDLKALQEFQFKKTTDVALQKVKKEVYDEEYLAFIEKQYTAFDKKLADLKDEHTQDKVFNERTYKEALEEFLIQQQVVDPAQLAVLAKNRALNIQHYLENQKINKQQIVILKEVINKTQNDKFAIVNLHLENIQ